MGAPKWSGLEDKVTAACSDSQIPIFVCGVAQPGQPGFVGAIAGCLPILVPKGREKEFYRDLGLLQKQMTGLLAGFLERYGIIAK